MGQSSTRQGFAVCQKKGSRQSWFCRRLFVVCCLPCAIHDKEFAVCIWVLLVSRSGGGNASIPKNIFSRIYELMTCIWKYFFQKQIINGITHSKKYFSKNGSDTAVTTRKQAIGLGQRYHRYQLQQQLVPLAFDRPSGGQLAPGGGSNRFQCVSIGTGLNHHPVPNEGGDIGTG